MRASRCVWPRACVAALVAVCAEVNPLSAAHVTADVTLYVATDGSDGNPGTEARPFATLQRARDEVRKRKTATGLPNGATVLVRAGAHFLDKTLVLGPEDSGTAKGPITYATYPGEKVALKGSRPVTGWKRHSGKIYRASLAGVDLGAGRFWEIFCGDRRMTLARFPNVDPKHPRTGGFLYVTGVVEEGSKTLLQYDPDRLDTAKWSEPTGAQVHVWSWLNWNRNICPIKAIDREQHVLTLARPASYKLIQGNRFFVENALEELDTPGEWYYDAKTRTLYFWPPDDRSPEGRVSVPVLPALVQLHGDRAKNRFVEHVRLRGFTLAESQGSLLELNMAAHCTVSACTLTHCHGTAVGIAGRSHHNQILGCDIAHVVSAAIVLSGVRDWSHSLDNRISHNLISNNHVHHVGEGGNAWGAIVLGPGCGGNCTHDNIISHNLVHDTPRQAITFNGFRNIVEYNHVHHTNQEQSDTGAIGMGSRDVHERGSIIRCNYIHDAGGYCMLKPGVWKYPHYCWGIYLDDYTSGVHVYGNLVVRAFRAGVMVHGGQDNVIENNIIVDSCLAQVEYSPIDHHTRGRTPTHPDKREWLMTGTKLIGNIFWYSHEGAAWLRGRKWQQVVAESDRNLVWSHNKPVKITLNVQGDDDYWTAWHKLGYDANSVIADPLFVDPKRGDYRLRPDSPALKLGFKPIAIEKAGLYESPDRASWPVSDDCWREEHIEYPEGPPKPPAPRSPRDIPKLKALRITRPPKIDGNVDAPGWDWSAPGSVAEIADLSIGHGKGKQPSRGMVALDAEALYIALVNRVSNAAKLPKQGGIWGRDDGAEICIQVVSGKTPGPILVVQGYPSGRCGSVDHAGAPLPAVRKLGQSVEYAAAIGDGQWSGEWRIPFAALGIDPSKQPTLRFNIGVLKAAEEQWIAWVSTGAAPWRMELAGELVLK